MKTTKEAKTEVTGTWGNWCRVKDIATDREGTAHCFIGMAENYIVFTYDGEKRPRLVDRKKVKLMKCGETTWKNP